MITAVEIDELYYAEPIKTVTTPAAGLTGAEVATILKNAATKRVKNVHGDTYQYEEAEASVTRYKNALTGEYYRETSEPGEVKINFTIGEYDYATKADLQGGKATEKNWERGKYKPIHKCVIGKTKDGVYVVFPKAAINARGSMSITETRLPDPFYSFFNRQRKRYKVENCLLKAPKLTSIPLTAWLPCM